MWETFTLFSSSYLATLSMGLVCAYLGVFCVMRRIVFTGVALAQLAAGGVAISFFIADLGLGPVSRFAATYGATWGSLGASLAGLLGLQARRRQARITEDALVGLAYSAAGALAILLVWRSSRGLTELQNILAGTVLLPQQSELVSLWIGLAAVVAVHAWYRRELLLVSFDPEYARAAGIDEHRYQLLFLATLAVAVALALKAGGLMLVFAFLVVPPLAGLTLGERLGESTLYALAIAATGSFLGFLCSIGLDWPVGPSVALCLVLLLGVSLIARADPQLLSTARRATLTLGAVAMVAGPAALIAAPAPAEAPAPTAAATSADNADVPSVYLGASQYGDADHEETLEEIVSELASADAATRVEVIPELVDKGPEALGPLLALAMDPDSGVRDAVDAALSTLLTDPAAALEFTRRLDETGMPSAERLTAAVAATRLGDSRGPLTIVDVLATAQNDLPLLAQDEAANLLRSLRDGEGFGYDAFASVEANGMPLQNWRNWLEQAGATAAAADAGAPLDGSGSAKAEVSPRQTPMVSSADSEATSAELAERLAGGSLSASDALAAARALLDRWTPDAVWNPAPAVAQLLEIAEPGSADLRRILKLLPSPIADDAWQSLAKRSPITASAIISEWLHSADTDKRKSASAGIDALLQPVVSFETVWSSLSNDSSRDELLIILAREAGSELSPALTARYAEAGAAAKAELLRRIGRELDARGWPLVGRAQTADDPMVRSAARDALAEFSRARAATFEWRELQEREKEAALLRSLRDQLLWASPEQAANAAQALADLGVRAAIPDMVAALDRDDPKLRDALRDALRQLGAPPTPPGDHH
ncbi:MAG: iron chelate uptake ABC transporter family permease subunit [Halieaceae bacterium]|jgi:ABC-type Mn2+/Zn2+ transport system permease subunit/HEAT repeat protein|nr:iron chelate uptake ABC transporter family permease subunit [Halieaceae bacterium]